MKANNIPLALTGNLLIQAMEEKKEGRGVIADGFLYEQTINMFYSPPGLGKSTITTQIAVELAVGLPIFGLYHVPKPIKVLYVQEERHIVELLERLQIISKTIPVSKENLVITSEYQILDMLNFGHVGVLIECIKRDCPDVKAIFFDPIYPMVAGGLKDDKPASAFTKAMSLVQKETSAMLCYAHHTTKVQHNTTKGEEIVKVDPFYGSQWLKAHATGCYNMTETPNGVKLACTKDNYNLLPKSIHLEYNPETNLCIIPSTELTAIDKVRNFLNVRRNDQKEFTFKDLQSCANSCARTIRRLLCHSSISEQLIVVSNIKNKKLYKMKRCT